MSEIKLDKGRVSAPFVLLAAIVTGCVPVIGGYFKFEHRLEALEAQSSQSTVAIRELRAADAETEKVILRIDFQLEAMLKSQQKVEVFIDELRAARSSQVRAARAVRQ